MIRFAQSSVRTIRDNVDRIQEIVKPGTKSVCEANPPESFWNKPNQTIWMWVSYIFIALETKKYIV